MIIWTWSLTITSHMTSLNKFLCKKDSYSDKNAGYFNMWYGGISVEMMGSTRPLSQSQLPSHLSNNSTRVQIDSRVWVSVPAHPGLYTRGRYGPGYLYHVQSWRHVLDMSASDQTYVPATWASCPTPHHHACLNNYPIQVGINKYCQFHLSKSCY